jgi:hypothetical protein
MQDVVAHMWHVSPHHIMEQKQLLLQQLQLRRHKARVEAIQQQQLMRRQSETSKKREMEKEEGAGLVIEEAMYYLDAEESLDVTIPVQFWVIDSTLTIAGGKSKGNLLGFYHLSNNHTVDKTKHASDSCVSNSWHVMKKWRMGFIRNINISRLPEYNSHRDIPLLHVRYAYHLLEIRDLLRSTSLLLHEVFHC